jgi:polysaccharide export outer membrane protein
MERSFRIVVLVAWVGFGAACAGSLRDVPSASELDNLAVEAKQNYVIGEADFLRVTVWNHGQLSLDSVVVRPDGKISMPLIDDVHAAGMTAQELKGVISERLSEYVADPEVTVVVLQINSKFVYVLGEVAREGPVSLRGNMRVVDVLATAGGFSPFADKDRVLIIRGTEAGAPKEFRFNYNTFVDGTNLAQNVLLLPGDKIVVP